MHEAALATLQQYCLARQAQLIVVPLRYKNPTSVWAAQEQKDDWWDEDVAPYLCSKRKHLAPGLVLAADVRTQPTATSPLSGFEALTGAESCIIGHPKMQLRYVAAPSGKWPKLLTTTGSVTVRNGTDSKTGKLGEFHHFLGAVVVERVRGGYHLRQLNCDRDTGECTDLDRVYTPRGSRAAPPAAALVLGDSHVAQLCPQTHEATFGADGITSVLRPKAIVVHDVFDGDSINPHRRDDPFASVALAKAGATSVRAEVERVREYLSEVAGHTSQVVVTDANHNDFLRRWLVSHDWRKDPGNAEWYLQTALALVQSAHVGPTGVEYLNPLAHHLAGLGGVKVLGPREPYLVHGIECGPHGHRGPNGARGSARNLARIGSKVVSGHTHTPAIEEGHYQCGTSSKLHLDYNVGPSSWMNGHVAVYDSGKRAIIVVRDGAWRA